MKAKGRIGDEIKYFEMISERGDAVDFAINCTSAFSDKELIETKLAIEKEVFEDFMIQHPMSSFLQFFSEHTPLAKINNLLVSLKMKGLTDGLNFVWSKVLSKLKPKRDRTARRWNSKETTYAWQQTLYQGHMPTF